MAGRIFNVEDPNNEAAGSAGSVGNTTNPPPHTAPVSASPVGNAVSPPNHAVPVPAFVTSKTLTGRSKLTRVPHCPPGYAVPVIARPLPHVAPGSAGPAGNTVRPQNHAALVPSLISAKPSTSSGKNKMTRVPQCPPGYAVPTSKNVMSNSQGRKSKLTLGIRQRSEPAPALVIPPCKYLQIYTILLYSSVMPL